MKILPNLTVVIVDCSNQGRAISAIQKTLKQITPEKTLFFTDIDISVPNVETIVIPKIKTKDEYSFFMLKKLYSYITTEYALIIQHDGYVLNGNKWCNCFLKYDYIGAKWLFPETERCVGNGGFSLRSKKLLDVVAKDNFISCTQQEDDTLCRLYGEYLEQKYSIKFAPPSIADSFSFELNEPVQKTFGFHGYFHQPYKEHIVIKRTAAMGDVIMVEPLIQYYHDKGYQVVLDTLPEMMHVFFNHPFKIKHISEMNSKITPEKVINLDMSYESKPLQSVLKSYYEFAGIKDGIMRNSRLNVNKNSHRWLFDKYICFHIDDTGMTYRNVHGVDWQFVTNYYTRLGYLVLQVGRGTWQNVGTYFHAETKQMLMYLLAGASAVCGIDSGVCQLSVALGVPTVIFTGSVDLRLRYQNFDNIKWVHNECPSGAGRFCYHEKEGQTVGSVCEFNKDTPPCAIASEWDVIKSLNKLLK